MSPSRKRLPRRTSITFLTLALLVGPTGGAVSPDKFAYLKITRQADPSVEDLSAAVLTSLIDGVGTRDDRDAIHFDDRFLVDLSDWDQSTTAAVARRLLQRLKNPASAKPAIEFSRGSWIGLTRMTQDQVAAAVARYEARIPNGGYDDELEYRDSFIRDLCEHVLAPRPE